MTYSTAENSANEGSPVELYEFAVGLVTHYYTSADTAITVGDNVYEPVLLDRDDIHQTSELNKTGLEIRMTRDNPIAEMFRVTPPDQVVVLTILRMHRTSPGDTAVFWSGRVLTPKWAGSGATLYCEPVSTSLKRPGLRRKYARMCPHLLYSQSCGVDSIFFRTSGDVTSVSATSITVAEAAAHPDGYFSGGYVSWVDSYGNVSSRTIELHVGTSMVLLTTAYGIDIGEAVTLYPGCNRTINLCDSLFLNSINYGGFPWLDNNPFDVEVF